MLGADNSDSWYQQPLLLTTGALLLGGLDPVVYHRPYRLLNDHLSYGFRYLAEYIELKASLFPATPRCSVPSATSWHKEHPSGTAD